jgi:hypothetical protein
MSDPPTIDATSTEVNTPFNGNILPEPTMSDAPITDTEPAEDSTSFDDDLEIVRRVIFNCLKKPTKVDTDFKSGEIGVVAEFDTSAPGAVFEKVQTSTGKIRVVATLDPATIEVNFETLQACMGLESAGEAAGIWDAVKKHLVSAPLDGKSTGWSARLPGIEVMRILGKLTDERSQMETPT